ncbi:type II toxin-antitoxin system PemK/MazF family toxin [Streptomyces sp. YIM 98790]|uniref:type II toxin-antitoxin system PemK/MazF family toxin n=1 Tax=Streptomyces sp. YIM 98790 TaxID=2689077 RepID=UPI0014091035|nr:type II toxin-antitoxin system PemK/MazF family toxin [Streptomyces sp. YIM 98790]
MDLSWWPALAAVIVLGFVAALVDGAGRLPGPPRRLRLPVRRTPRSGPRPGDIWYAALPGGEPEAPALVLAVDGRDGVRVARISSRPGGERPGAVPLPPGTVGQPRGGSVETEDLLWLPAEGLRRRAGALDPLLWDQVRTLTGP